ncbi:MAG: hypothetical protein LIP10_00700 [Clostridiales bacterium]|nr:hypothetical protein [Clostridiales bacterium]
MKNKKRLTALLLATVLVCSQVSTIGSPVTAEETELTTEAAEAAEAVSEESEAATGETVSASAETADNDAETPDADSTDADESADVAEAVTEGMTEAVTESTTGDVAEGTVDGSTEAATEAVSEAEGESEDETETETIEDVNAGISLAGLDLDGSVSAVDEEEEENGEDEDSESWWLDVSWPNGTNQLLVGETVSATVYVGHHYYYEDGDDGWWEDETLEFNDFIYTLNYDTEAISVSDAADEDGYGVALAVTGKEEGDARITIRVYIDGTQVIRENLDFYVSDSGYYYLTADTSDGIYVPLGEDYNLTECGFTLYYVSDENGEVSTTAVSEDEYTLVVDDFEDYCFDSCDGLVLTKRIHTDGTYAYVSAYADPEDSDSGLAGTSIWFDGLEYSIDMSLTDEYLSGYGDYIVYGYPQTVTFSATEGYESLPDGYTVTWDLYDDTGLLEISGEGTSATLTLNSDNTDYDGWWAGVAATVWYDGDGGGDGAEIAYNEIWFEVVIPYYSTDELPSDLVLVINETGYVELEPNSYVRSYDIPYGDNVTLSLNVDTYAILSDYSEYISITESGTGLDITGLNSTDGTGIEVPYTYENPVTGDIENGSFYVYVQGSKYTMWGEYLDETSEMLPNATKEIETYLNYYESNDEDYSEETVEDYEKNGYTLHVDTDSIDTDIFTVEISEDDPSRLIVTAVSSGGQDIYAYITDAEGQIVADTWIWVNVTDLDGYYTLSADSVDLALGETVDMNDLDEISYTLTYYYTDANGDNQKEIVDLDDGYSYMVIESYDDGCWNAVEDSDTQLTRKGNWQTWVDVHVMLYNEETEDYDEIASCGVEFGDLNYDSSLTAAYDGEETSNLIVGEAATITLEESYKNDYEFPDGYTVKYDVHIEGEEDWEDASKYGAEWSFDDNILTLTVASDDYTYVVCATVYYEDEDNVFSYAELYLSATEADIIYYAESDTWRILKGDSTTLHAYQIVYSTEYPEGEVTELPITAVGVKRGDVYDDSADEDSVAVEIGESTESGTEITGIYEGWADLYTYVTVDGKEILCGTDNEDGETVYIEVDSGYYYLDLEDSYTISLQDEDPTITLEDILRLTYLDENDETIDKAAEFESISFQWYDEDTGEYFDSFDSNIIDVSEEDGVITITGLEEGETGLQITVVYAYDDETRDPYEESTWIQIYVQGKNDAEIMQSDGTEAVTEYTEEYDPDSSFNLGLKTNSDNKDGLQYKVTEGAEVVKVDNKGNVTIIGIGTAVIKVWVGEGDTYYETEITITVVGEKASVTFENDGAVTKTYGDEEFDLTVKADNTESVLSYTSSDPSVVTVDSTTGKVTIVGAGTAEITVSAAETDYFKSAKTTVAVTVEKAEAAITGSLSYDKYMTDSAFTLDTVLNHDETTLTYEVVANAQVVSVDENGLVTILEPGAAEIKVSAAETANYKAATDYVVGVTVIKATASITPATSTQTVTYGHSIVLSADNLGLTVVGDGTPTYTVTSGTDVLSISDSTAATLKAGTAVIKVSMAATDKYYAADDVTITVTVNKADGTGSVTITGWVAGETANAPAATSATNGTDNVTYYYKVQGADDSTYTTTVPTTAGSYTVKAVFAATDNYNEVSATSNFTVLDMSGYVELDTNVDDLSDITLPTGWAWVSGQEILPGAINYVQAVNSSTSETITVPVALIPHITSNDTFTKGEDTSAVIKCSGELQYFKGLKVDGKEVAATSYTATHGSTILTFTQDYMNTLSVGAHTVTLTYETGDLDATLTVLEKSTTETESETTATESETTATESETETATEIATEIETETETDTEEATETTTTASGESETTSSDSVSTGDETPIATTLAVMLLAAALLIAGAAYRRMYGRRR